MATKANTAATQWGDMQAVLSNLSNPKFSQTQV